VGGPQLTGAPAGSCAPVDPGHFRHVLGQYPTGVVVITALTADGEPAGMTVGSFSSVSVDPPLISFMPSRTSSSWSQLRPSPRFCVNVLGAHQDDVCRAVASRKQDKFRGIELRRSAHGNPVIAGCVAVIDCTLEAIVDGGDHEIVIGRVQALALENATLPLLFFRGGYGSFRPGAMLSGDASLVDHLRLVDIGRPHLESLARDLDVEVTTIALAGDEVVVTAAMGARPATAASSRVGYRAPFMPPLGSIHAAWGTEAVRERWLASLGPAATPETTGHYRQVLDEVRRRGYATSLTTERQLDELALGMSRGDLPPSMSRLREHVRGVAAEFDPTRRAGAALQLRGLMAPVFDSGGQVAYQVMMWGEPDISVDAAEIDRCARALLAAARGATAAIGGRPPDA
jgi:flavin reductase (DIM6/NTAB) family NADH-FMN oxidoreductase RutF